MIYASLFIYVQKYTIIYLRRNLDGFRVVKNCKTIINRISFLIFLDIIAKFANNRKTDNSLFEKQTARALSVSLHFYKKYKRVLTKKL